MTMTLYNKERFAYECSISTRRRLGGRLDAEDDMDRATRREQRRRVDVRHSRIAEAITCWPSAVCTPVHHRRQARGEGEGHGGTRGGLPSHDRCGTPYTSGRPPRCRCV